MSDELIKRPLDEVYDTQMEVERNPCGAWQAIQEQADRIAAARPPMHPVAMNGWQSFATEEDVTKFWRSQPADSTFLHLDMIQTLRTPVAIRAITEASHD